MSQLTPNALRWPMVMPSGNSRYTWDGLFCAMLSILGCAAAGITSFSLEIFIFAILYWTYQARIIQIRQSANLAFTPNLIKQLVDSNFNQVKLLMLAKFALVWATSGFEPALNLSAIYLVLHLAMAWGGVQSNLASQWPFYAILPLIFFKVDLTQVLPWHNLMIIPVIIALEFSQRVIPRLHCQRGGAANETDHYEWRFLPGFQNNSIVLLNPILRPMVWGKHAAIGGVLIHSFAIGAVVSMVPNVQTDG